MYLLLSLSSRDLSPVPRVTTSFEKTCRSVSWRVWCPIDIILWATIALIFALLFWKLYQKTTKGDSESDEQRPPNLPLNAPLRDDLSIKNHNCPCCIPDPHLIAHSRQSSILTKDASVLSTPAPALLANDTQKNSSSRRLTGLGITFGSTSMTDGDLPFQIPQIQGISRQGSSKDLYPPPSVIMANAVETGNKSTPPPAYALDIRADR